MNIIQCTF